ncbi:MAG: uracil-DNA glycosylase [Pirellulales bacterium]
MSSSTEMPEQWADALNHMSDDAAETLAASHAAAVTPASAVVSSDTRPLVTTSQIPTQQPGSNVEPPQQIPVVSAAMSQEGVPASVGQLFAKKAAFTTADGQSWQSDSLDEAARLNLFQILNQEIRACRKCSEICSFRQQTVFGVGPIRPTVCFMGEAPGADEDKQGEPFVGRAGQLLTRIIEAMQLKREEVYILNSLKCRPPGNRTPLPDEITNCFPYVETQLETLQPRYIVCLGAVAVRSLLKTDAPVGQLRGRFFSYRGARVLVTYHPSYLLRNESAKKLVWEDMQILMRELGIEVPKKK